ncbi:RNA polymerase II transcription factor B subunit 4 [Boothiomyces sp. JEL0838]|nr:RNA polymerase II transcription factor B subunit 4 [Boothiomyces sp. JEL0838]
MVLEISTGGSLLIVILDLLSDLSALEQIILFIHAHQSQRHGNELLLIGSNTGGNTILYPRDDLEIPNTRPANVNTQFHAIDTQIEQSLEEAIQKYSSNSKYPKLSGAISTALTLVNKLKVKTEGSFLSRIIVFSSSKDDSAQHISMMNTMFAAQRAEIPIDVCRMTETPSIYLAQASYITHGIYAILKDKNELIHNLLYLFLADTDCRSMLSLPKNDKIDFRATCFCHKRNIDMGFVCSVCLSSKSFII